MDLTAEIRRLIERFIDAAETYRIHAMLLESDAFLDKQMRDARDELRVALLAASSAPIDESGSVITAAEDYAKRCVEASGRRFEISALIDLKAWFYAGARWSREHPAADVRGPSSSTMAASPAPAETDPLANLRAAKYLNPECAENGCQWLRAASPAPEEEATRLLLAMARDWTDPAVVRDAPDRVPHVIEQLIAEIERRQP